VQDLCIAPFNCALLEGLNCLYFNCDGLGECELSRSETPDYYFDVISCDLWMQNGACGPWCPPDDGGLTAETCGGGVTLIQIYNCKQCACLLVYLNS
jgi:hypothetical protein